MLITKPDGEYILRCFSAGKFLPKINTCSECGNEFMHALGAEPFHGVIRFPGGAFSIIIGCEGYHQIRFDDEDSTF